MVEEEVLFPANLNLLAKKENGFTVRRKSASKVLLFTGSHLSMKRIWGDAVQLGGKELSF